ncbi:MAG: hypothetical protein JWN63_3122 [Candidatus Acidoferrum typicum]|nr:hypothetical protein [Candidatus Acidoferrum typicum]
MPWNFLRASGVLTFSVSCKVLRSGKQKLRAGAWVKCGEGHDMILATTGAIPTSQARASERLGRAGGRIHCEKDYSYLNATIGSTRMARRAGT